MVTANAQRQRVGDGTSGMTLTERQKGLAACACLMAQGSWLQHLTYHKDIQEGASNEWCEAVSNEQYDALSK